jgi:hypothetical protein
LDGYSKFLANTDKSDPKKMALLAKIRKYSLPAMLKLHELQKGLDAMGRVPFKNPQLEVSKDVFFKNRIAEIPDRDLELKKGDVLVKVESFAYTANNITYAVAADMVGYWQFFPPAGENKARWGVIPVWGFAQVVASKSEGIPVGDRLFGFFPPAKHVKMTPVGVSESRFTDGAAHRSELPKGYNIYQRVLNEKNYNPAFDRERMLLWPLLLTSFCLWNALKDANWHGAEQIIILSASSKTSIGLGYALQADTDAPKVIGVTSDRNLEKVIRLGIYDQCLGYDTINGFDAELPTVIVDMSGNTRVLATLHSRLGNNMKFTHNVGLTHWTHAKPQEGIIKERSAFFFAPGHIQKLLKEWGPNRFEQETSTFLIATAKKARTWLKFREVNGLEELAGVHPAVCQGTLPPDEGLIVVME